MTEDIVFICESVYVKKKDAINTQTFSESQIKLIETNFSMAYTRALHFVYSNAPVLLELMEDIILLLQIMINFCMFYHLIKMII